VKSGPRIHFKRDEESAIGRGAVMHGAHFRPEVASMVWAACRGSASFGWPELWVTEGWRPSSDRRDLHSELRAIDISCRHIEGDEKSRVNTAGIWAKHVASLLGPDYDVVVHGARSNLHLHVELDP